jgi:hypothetical protein
LNTFGIMTGPLTLYPNWLYRNGAVKFVAALRLRVQLLASSWLLRKYSYKVPWNSFVPERVTMRIWPAAERPYSAE